MLGKLDDDDVDAYDDDDDDDDDGNDVDDDDDADDDDGNRKVWRYMGVSVCLNRGGFGWRGVWAATS